MVYQPRQRKLLSLKLTAWFGIRPFSITVALPAWMNILQDKEDEITDKQKDGLLTVITARALLSAKSKPSLTFPRHTARNSAPVSYSSSIAKKLKWPLITRLHILVTEVKEAHACTKRHELQGVFFKRFLKVKQYLKGHGSRYSSRKTFW